MAAAAIACQQPHMKSAHTCTCSLGGSRRRVTLSIVTLCICAESNIDVNIDVDLSLCRLEELGQVGPGGYVGSRVVGWGNPRGWLAKLVARWAGSSWQQHSKALLCMPCKSQTSSMCGTAVTATGLASSLCRADREQKGSIACLSNILWAHTSKNCSGPAAYSTPVMYCSCCTCLQAESVAYL